MEPSAGPEKDARNNSKLPPILPLANQDYRGSDSEENLDVHTLESFPGKLEGSLRLSRYSSSLPVPSQKDALQKSALLLIEWIDTCLLYEVIHFRRSNGELLTTLDEVVNALLSQQLEIEWRFDLSGSFEEVEARTRELRYNFQVVSEREQADAAGNWRRILRTGKTRY